VGVSVRGELDDREPDAGYTVEIAIPWQAFRPSEGKRIPPTPGDVWRANLYVMDRGWERQRAVAWVPVGVRDFHVPKRFGILAFVGPPEDMMRESEPSTMPPGRMPALQQRMPRAAPDLSKTLIEKQQTRRRLESTGGGN
jgi:hypothetical protein